MTSFGESGRIIYSWLEILFHSLNHYMYICRLLTITSSNYWSAHNLKKTEGEAFSKTQNWYFLISWLKLLKKNNHGIQLNKATWYTSVCLGNTQQWWIIILRYRKYTPNRHENQHGRPQNIHDRNIQFVITIFHWESVSLDLFIHKLIKDWHNTLLNIILDIIGIKSEQILNNAMW